MNFKRRCRSAQSAATQRNNPLTHSASSPASPNSIDTIAVRRKVAGMKQILLMIAVVAGQSVLAADEFREKELTDANYAKWRDHVLPKNWELSYRRIPWRTSFWDAVIEAQARDKPILLWAMNGHPLCNT